MSLCSSEARQLQAASGSLEIALPRRTEELIADLNHRGHFFIHPGDGLVHVTLQEKSSDHGGGEEESDTLDSQAFQVVAEEAVSSQVAMPFSLLSSGAVFFVITIFRVGILAK